MYPILYVLCIQSDTDRSNFALKQPSKKRTKQRKNKNSENKAIYWIAICQIVLGILADWLNLERKNTFKFHVTLRCDSLNFLIRYNVKHIENKTIAQFVTCHWPIIHLINALFANSKKIERFWSSLVSFFLHEVK